MKTLRFVTFLSVAALAGAALGCSSSSTPPTPAPPARPNLYVTACSGTHMIDVFTPPFTAASVPSVTVPFPAGNVCVLAAALLSGNQIAIGTGSAGWYIYQLPLTNTSAPTAHVTTTTFVGGLVQDTSGNLLVSDRTNSKVLVYPPPFTSASTASVTFTGGLAGPYILDMNSAGLLFVGNCNNATVTTYTPPFTNATTATATITPTGGVCTEGIGLDASGNLYVGDFSNNDVWIYSPPYTNASVPVTTITGGPGGTSEPASFAFDAAGNIYQANYNASTITVYSPPLTAASTPTVTIHTETDPAQILFGP